MSFFQDVCEIQHRNVRYFWSFENTENSTKLQNSAKGQVPIVAYQTYFRPCCRMELELNLSCTSEATIIAHLAVNAVLDKGFNKLTFLYENREQFNKIE